jgi:hypothetical protein
MLACISAGVNHLLKMPLRGVGPLLSVMASDLFDMQLIENRQGPDSMDLFLRDAYMDWEFLNMSGISNFPHTVTQLKTTSFCLYI